MAWQIKWSKNAQKSFDKLDKNTQKIIRNYLVENIILSETNPRTVGKALTGTLKGLWRYRIGDYRVVCQIIDKEVTVLVVHLGHRKNVYK
jgi:mRNA interferase RelE/StbE